MLDEAGLLLSKPPNRQGKNFHASKNSLPDHEILLIILIAKNPIEQSMSRVLAFCDDCLDLMNGLTLFFLLLDKL